MSEYQENSVPDESILNLFEGYKKFCCNQIESTTSNDIKIKLMNEIIRNLFDQNEQLIRMIMEVRQSTMVKSEDMQKFMVETACKTIDIGQALASYELEMKKFSEQVIPSILHYGQILDSLEKENQDLKGQNQVLTDDIQKINIELNQYKNSICNLMAEPFDKWHDHYEIKGTSESNTGFIELFVDKNLKEQKEKVESMICASLLDELIYSVELNTAESIIENTSKFLKYPTKTIDHLFDYEEEVKFEDTWCNIMADLQNNNAINQWHKFKINESHYFYILSIILNEIKFKNTVITNIRNDFRLSQRNFLALHYKFIERGLKILKFLLNIVDNYNENERLVRIVKNMTNEIEEEIKDLICMEENDVPTDYDQYHSILNYV